MIRIFFALALSAGVAACGRGRGAARPACPASEARGPLNFTVSVSSVPTAVRRDLSLDEIARVQGGSERRDGGRTQGLTVVEHRLDYRTEVAVTTPPRGGPACAWIASLSVDMTPGQVTIYVPRDYAPDSCEAREILLHERRHEEIHRRLLAQAVEDERAALAKADRLPTRGTPIPVSDRAEADRRFEALLDRILDPVYDGFKNELELEQAAIDTPDSYRQVTARCSGWK